MGRIKLCRMCGETLYCQRCGTRQTPETPGKSKYTILFTPEQRKEIERKANERGMTAAAYIRDVLGVAE